MSSRHIAVMAVLILSVRAIHAEIIATNLAVLGSASTELGANAAINDQNYATQADSGTDVVSWAAVVWSGSPKPINKLIVEHCTGYVVKGFDVQIAKAGVASPAGGTDGDWETLPGGQFTNQAAGGTDVFRFDVGQTRTGVRVRATDKSNIVDTRMRIREIWAFNNYSNHAVQATISAPGWSGGATTDINDETMRGQLYTSAVNVNSNINLTWTARKLIGAIMIHGGAGAGSEKLIDYVLQQKVGASWQDIVSVTGNTQKTVYHLMVPPISTDGLKLVVFKADNNPVDWYARVAEIFVFAATPARGTVILVQ